VSTDRSSREVELEGDLAVALALTQQFQHFELGIRKLTQRAAFRLSAAIIAGRWVYLHEDAVLAGIVRFLPFIIRQCQLTLLPGSK
jgi:hypothetical protein